MRRLLFGDTMRAGGRSWPRGKTRNRPMSDQPENLTLVFLGRIDQKVDGLREDMTEVKERLGHLEGQYSNLSRRVDRLSGDVEQIKRRLDFVPAG